MGIVLSPSLVLPFSSSSRRVSPWILWENKITFGNISSDEAAESYPITNICNPQTSSYWVAETTDEQVITIVDLSGQIDALGIAKHNFGTAQVTVSVEGVNAVSSPDFEVICDEILPGDDEPLLFKFEKDAYTSVRLRMVPGGSTPPQIAVAKLGETLVVPTGISPDYTPMRDALDIDLSAGRSQRGEFLGSWVLGSGLSGSTSLSELGDTWYRTYMRPFLDAADRGATFFWAWSPIVRPTEVAYCWFSRTSKRSIGRVKPTWRVDMSMSGILS